MKSQDRFGRLLQVPKRLISPSGIVRGIQILAGIWFLVVFPILNLSIPHRLPKGLQSSDCDFGQYYIGAIVAKKGAWDALYPIAKPEVYNTRPQFKPIYKTSLFKGENLEQKRWLYPTLAEPPNSDFSPKLTQICPELTEKFSFRYMYPPPLALLLWPLSFWDYETVRMHVWPILSMAALFGVGLCSSRTYRILHGGKSYTEGLIMGAVWVFSFSSATAIHDGNVSPILSFLIACTLYSWITNRQITVGAAMIPLLVFKGIGVTWCPLFLIRPVRWKAIFSLAFFTVALNGAMLYLAGSSIYQQFFVEVFPKISMPVGHGIVPGILYNFGIYPSKVYLALNLLVCIALCFGYWKGLGAKQETVHHSTVAATLAGSVALFCALNFSVWGHYLPCYLFFPFLGWMVWEIEQAKGRWQLGMILGLAIIFFFIISGWEAGGVVLRIAGKRAMLVYIELFRNVIWPFLFPVFFLIIAFRRLFFLREPISSEQNTVATGSTYPSANRN